MAIILTNTIKTQVLGQFVNEHLGGSLTPRDIAAHLGLNPAIEMQISLYFDKLAKQGILHAEKADFDKEGLYQKQYVIKNDKKFSDLLAELLA